MVISCSFAMKSLILIVDFLDVDTTRFYITLLIIFIVGFRSGLITMDDLDVTEELSTANGTLPDGIYAHDTSFYFCCRDDGKLDVPIVLPKERPFILFVDSSADACQEVRGKKLMITRYKLVKWLIVAKRSNETAVLIATMKMGEPNMKNKEQQ